MSDITKQQALDAWKKMRSEIDEENWLFVGTINPKMVDYAIEAMEHEMQKDKKIVPPTCLTNPERYEELLERYKEE